MQRLLYLTGVVLLACLSCGSVEAGLADEVVAPYVEVREHSQTYCGSGVVVKVGDETLILTAGHVVRRAWDQAQKKDTETFKVFDEWFKEIGGYRVKKPVMHLLKKERGRVSTWKAEVVFFSPHEEEGGHDLALLRPLNAGGLTPVSGILTQPLDLGEDAWYIGTGSGVHGRLEKSIIAGINHEEWGDGLEWTMVNGNGWYGNSGGPLFVKRDGKYVLAGIVVALAAVNDPKSPVLAETPETIRDFLKMYEKSRGKLCVETKDGLTITWEIK